VKLLGAPKSNNCWVRRRRSASCRPRATPASACSRKLCQLGVEGAAIDLEAQRPQRARPGFVEQVVAEQVRLIAPALRDRGPGLAVLIPDRVLVIPEISGRGFFPTGRVRRRPAHDATHEFPLNESCSLALKPRLRQFSGINKNAIWDQYPRGLDRGRAALRDQPYLLGYDLFNEPWPGTLWALCFEIDCRAFDAKLQSFLEQALAGVRAADTTHFAFLRNRQQLFDFGAPSSFTAVADPALALSWHDYCSATLLAAYGLPDGPDCPLIEPRTMNNADAQIAALGAASLINRVRRQRRSHRPRARARPGGSAPGRLDLLGVQNLRRPDRLGTGREPVRRRHRPQHAQVGQGRSADPPYAQAVAGVPTSTSFDETTKLFTLDYTPRTATAPTEIFTAPRHYPNGYAAVVAGGHVVSASGATLLQVVADPGANTVHVEVRPQN